MDTSWRERLVVFFSFLLIFAFNSVDNAISPLIGPISQNFGIDDTRALWLISFCSGGTVVGLFFGPALLQSVSAKKCLGYVLTLLVLTQILFALSSNFILGNALRFGAGFAAGLVASVMWQLTFHGVSKAYFPAMIAVLMSARPLATALGVPLAGLLAFNFDWRLPIWIIAILVAISGALLYVFYPQKYANLEENTDCTCSDREDSKAVSSASSSSGVMRILRPYGEALAVKYAVPYYLGSTINRMAYFGFYAFCGIWFAEHYGMNLKDISFALLIIGLAEALVNFSTNKIISWCGHKATFLGALGLSAILLPLFIFGRMGIAGAIACIAVFMLLDRIYSMALVISVPKMFPSKGDMTAFGSLNTLTAWGAMSLISWIQGLLGGYGLECLEMVILSCFYLGSAMLIFVQKKTVFCKVESIK